MIEEGKTLCQTSMIVPFALVIVLLACVYGFKPNSNRFSTFRLSRRHGSLENSQRVFSPVRMEDWERNLNAVQRMLWGPAASLAFEDVGKMLNKISYITIAIPEIISFGRPKAHYLRNPEIRQIAASVKRKMPIPPSVAAKIVAFVDVATAEPFLFLSERDSIVRGEYFQRVVNEAKKLLKNTDTVPPDLSSPDIKWAYQFFNYKPANAVHGPEKEDAQKKSMI